MAFLREFSEPTTVITAIDSSVRFPEILDVCMRKYNCDIEFFRKLVNSSLSSGQLLEFIRSSNINGDQRMSLLKMFRRCVSPVLDTEMAKKINKVKTIDLINAFGHTFKDINLLKIQFNQMSADQHAALAALIGEYDSRGQSGYILTNLFFDFFERTYAGIYKIEGPRGAGRDIELSTVFKGFFGDYPCDFVIRDMMGVVKAIGFARYDSTRGGAQSDDRTGGNSDKVFKAQEYCRQGGERFRMIFLADGPGLAHSDTWREAVKLDDSWDGNVRVVTLKTAAFQLLPTWIG